MDAIIDVAIPVAVIIIMFSIGFGVTGNDIRAALAAQKAFLVGVTAQLMLIPVTVFLFLILLQPAREIGLGIMILALCPGGALSNILTKVAGGDVALSVSMTAFTNVLSVATLPTLSMLAASYFVGTEVNASQIQDITLQVALIGTVPVLLGMFLRYIAPTFAERHGQSFFRISLMVFVLIMGWSIIKSIDVFYASMIALGWQLLVLLCLILTIGIVTGRLCKIAIQQRVSLVFEIGVQNSALGIAIGAIIWHEASAFPIYATPAAVYGSLKLLLLLPIAALASRPLKHAAAAKH